MTVTKICSSLSRPMMIAALGASLIAAHPGAALAQDTQGATIQGPSTSALMDRIDRLERDIRTLNQQIARMPASSDQAPAATPATTEASNVAQPQFNAGEGLASRMMVRLDALESEVRAATGQSESLSFRIDQLTQRFDKLLVDLDYRLARLEGSNPGSFDTLPKVSAAPAPVGVSKVGAMPAVGEGTADQGSVSKDGTYQPPAGSTSTLGTISKATLDAQLNGMKDGEETPDTTDAVAPVQAPAPSDATASPQADATTANVESALPEGSAQDRYRFAFDLTRQARYEEAEIAFKAFIDAHGADDLANNARYWLAETYYVRKRFMESAQAFFEAYQKAPEGPKAADSLLKLGMSMAGLEKTTEACATFGKLRKEFSPLKANIEQALNREVKRLDCK